MSSEAPSPFSDAPGKRQCQGVSKDRALCKNCESQQLKNGFCDLHQSQHPDNAAAAAAPAPSGGASGGGADEPAPAPAEVGGGGGGKRSGKRDAGAGLLGFLYQFYVTLEIWLSLPVTAELWVETVEDLVVDDSGQKTFYQVKHTTMPNTLTDPGHFKKNKKKWILSQGWVADMVFKGFTSWLNAPKSTVVWVSNQEWHELPDKCWASCKNWQNGADAWTSTFTNDHWMRLTTGSPAVKKAAKEVADAQKKLDVALKKVETTRNATTTRAAKAAQQTAENCDAVHRRLLQEARAQHGQLKESIDSNFANFVASSWFDKHAHADEVRAKIETDIKALGYVHEVHIGAALGVLVNTLFESATKDAASRKAFKKDDIHALLLKNCLVKDRTYSATDIRNAIAFVANSCATVSTMQSILVRGEAAGNGRASGAPSGFHFVLVPNVKKT